VAEHDEVRTIADIPGWFSAVDQWLFGHFLSDGVVPRGDLVEIGVYLGKSAALVGKHRRADETFTVCDLFGGTTDDPMNAAENQKSYSTLSREKFERNYLAIHSELPVVVQGVSSTILDHVKPSSARFVHVDGSHLYEHVAIDVESARTMLVPDGVVAFDDFRSPHTPGVAAAVWEAVFKKGLHPICLTRQKMYATFGDPGQHRARLEVWLAADERYNAEVQQIGGAPVLRIIEARRAAPAGPRPDIKQVSAELGRLAKSLASVDRKVTTLQREVVRQRSDQRSVVERGLRRAARMVRSKAAQRSVGR
jgi:hypothetical protein